MIVFQSVSQREESPKILESLQACCTPNPNTYPKDGYLARLLEYACGEMSICIDYHMGKVKEGKRIEKV